MSLGLMTTRIVDLVRSAENYWYVIFFSTTAWYNYGMLPKKVKDIKYNAFHNGSPTVLQLLHLVLINIYLLKEGTLVYLRESDNVQVSCLRTSAVPQQREQPGPRGWAPSKSIIQKSLFQSGGQWAHPRETGQARHYWFPQEEGQTKLEWLMQPRGG